MATKAKDPADMTWREKLDNGHPLNALDETKADADFNYKSRLREEEERKAFEKLKTAGKTTPEALAQLEQEQSQPAQDDGGDE